MRADQLQGILGDQLIGGSFPGFDILRNGRDLRVVHLRNFMAVYFNFARGGGKRVACGIFNLAFKCHPGLAELDAMNPFLPELRLVWEMRGGFQKGF